MLAAGDPATARHRAEDAVDAFAESGAPFDVARARLGLARALAALGRAELAERERESARAVFEELGAVRDAARAAEPLPAPQTDPNRAAEQEEEPGARSGVVQDAAAAGDGALDVLTPRELEVLRLIANGASDAKIAEELVISAHTVHRHVANIRNKLGLSSRAAAVAYATRSGLI
jgi:DNA-binding NarL/FixJ family response regulator